MTWVLRIGVAVMTAVVLVLGAIALIPAAKITALAARELEARTGRAITIGEPVKPSIWPVLGVETGPVTVANASWSKEGPFLQAEGLDLGLDLMALFRGEVVIESLVLTAPVVTLEQPIEGAPNWDFAVGGADEDALSASLIKAEVTDGRVVYINHRTGERTDIAGLAVTAAMPQADGPLTAAVRGEINGQDVTLALSAADGAGVLAGRVVPVAAEATAGAARIAFDGRAGGAPFAAEGALTADLGDPRALAALLGTGNLDLPEGLGARAIALAGEVTLAPAGSVHLRSGTLTLDGNSLAGAADVTFDGPRPKVVAKLTAGALTVPGVAAAGGDVGGTAGWSTEALGIGGLGALDAEVGLTADSLSLGALTAAPLEAQVMLDRARAVTEIRRLGLFGGSVSGQFVLNDRDGLSVGGDLAAAGIDLKAALAVLGGYERLSGQGSGQLRFLGVGESPAAIMASLSGEGRLDLGPGDFAGLDLAAILRALDPAVRGDGATDFDRVTASFTMADGTLTNRDLRLEAPGIAATGEGTVGLGAQVIDYRIAATALAGADSSGGIGVPLQITGPWADPKLTLDLRALAERELEAERAELEARARAAAEAAQAEVEERLREETGIDPQEGETLEDAARRRAQEFLEEEAGRFLEGLSGQEE
jgi:AsmA protein